MARFPKFALTLAFVATPFFGYDGRFNIPDPTGPDALTFNLGPARSPRASDLHVFNVGQARPWDSQRTRLMPAVASPTGARGASLFVYRRRSVPRHDRRGVPMHQYVWFVDESGLSKITDRLAVESWEKGAAANAGLRLNLPRRNSTPSMWFAATMFPSRHLTCFRRGA